MRIMLQLPRETHRYFIEPLSRTAHIVKSIKKRFTGFLSKIRSSRKEILRHVLRIVEYDCRSTTGRNIRKLRLTELNANNPDPPYMPVPEDDKWKISFAEELMNINEGALIVEGLTKEEIH